jgi:uncharacterized membrane protein
MAALIYSLCALTGLICAILLLRSYQQTRVHLLLWSGLCFAGLTGSNVILVLDRIIYPEVDLVSARLATALIALLLLLFGLIWENE